MASDDVSSHPCKRNSDRLRFVTFRENVRGFVVGRVFSYCEPELLELMHGEGDESITAGARAK